ncbi:hypothetical protein E2R60_29930 [Paenibacillus dendritiformis]|nr:transposase [Paenibacillus dendritiformis]TDL47402.1 hypothetical protein E2R60_29930 [Paenibacillus dendritiformis]
MKYKQKMKMNQRIEQITESTLMVGADIAKDLHVARAIDFRAIEIGNECVFSNNNTGFEALLLWMKELQAIIGKTKAILGIEPTGHYWFTLSKFLQQHGIKLVLVNPHHVNKTKELEDNSPTKNDYKDSKVIADLVRNGKYTEPKIPTGIYADLRIFMNAREKMMRGRSRLRAILFRAVMPMVAKNPEFKALHQYFTKRSNNPLKKKQSSVALCGKLIRVLHTLRTKRKIYNPIDVLGPHRQSQLQPAA